MAHLLKVMMLTICCRMARRMQNIRSRLNAAIILVGALLISPCSSPHAQSPTDTSPNQQLANPQTTHRNQAVAPAASPDKRLSKNFTLKGDSDWLDTGIDVAPGEHIVATAKRKPCATSAPKKITVQTAPRGFKDLLRILPFNAAGRGALIGRVGDATWHSLSCLAHLMT